ncbi:MAG: NHL repeat-containing protein [Planctomycetota bacterium]|jgi:YVTN family beta-propeller protein
MKNVICVTLLFSSVALMAGAAAGQSLSAVFELASEASFSRPHDLVLAPDGRLLYVADVGNNVVKVLDPETLATVGRIGKGELSSPHDVAFDGDGRLLVADTGNDRIARYSLEGTSGRLVDQLVGKLSSPEGVAVGPDGRIYVTNASGSDVVVFAEDRVVARAGRRGAGENQYVRPHDIHVDPAGKVYVSEPGNNRIQVLDGALGVLETIGPPAHGFHEPKYFDLDPRGWLYVADEYNHQIKVLDSKRKLVLVIGTGQAGEGPDRFHNPEGLEISGRRLWISDTLNHRVVRYRLDEN